MGIEYNLFNHSNCTYYELGKGPWYFLSDEMWVLHDAEILAMEILEEWEPSFEGSEGYVKEISADLCHFVGDTPDGKLQLIGDSGDEHWMARSLGYVCAGSRYNLGEPEKNRENIECQNRMSRNPLDPSDLEMLRDGGWNLSKYHEVPEASKEGSAPCPK